MRKFIFEDANLNFFFCVDRFSRMKESLKPHVNKIWCFFSIWVFFHKHSWFTGRQWIQDAVSLSPLHYLPFTANHAKFLSSLWIRLEFLHSSCCARKDSWAFKYRYRKVRQMGSSDRFFDFLKKLSALTWISKSSKTFHFGIRPASWIAFWIFCIYLNNLPIHIKYENEPIRSNHGCIKPGISTDNYSSIHQKIV